MKKQTILTIIGGLAMTALSPAAIVTWTGLGADNNWATAANWDTGSAPAASDTVIIGSTFTGAAAVTHTSNLPGGVTIELAGELNSLPGALRLNGATINAASTAIMSGDFWDLNNATFTFEDGAQFTGDDWEHKGTNSFTFNLGVSGFDTLTPNNYRENSVVSTSYSVDLANYTGGVGVIDLVDFQSATTNLTSAKFDAYNLTILNAGSNVANWQYDEANDIIQLNITAVPEPSSVALLGLGGLALLARRRS